MKSKWWKAGIAAVLLAAAGVAAIRMSGGGRTVEPDPVPAVDLFMIQNKPEVADVFVRLAADYHAENPGVRMRVETFGGGVDFSSRLQTLIQAGDAPDLFTNDGYALLDPWMDYAADLSDQPWVSDVLPGGTTPVMREGRVYGMPESMEGFGFACNTALLEKAGVEEIPETLTALEEACGKLKAAGILPFANSYAEWWVLGNHNMNVPLAHQEDPQAFIDGIVEGRFRFSSGRDLDGWLKLLRLTYVYGQPNSVTEGDYATSVAMFASGQAAMIQQGNWIQPALDKVDPQMALDFVPMPLSDVPDRKIFAGVTNFFIVNAKSPDAQAAKDFLVWLWSSETGRRYLTDELKYVPCFRSVPTGTLTGLNASLARHLGNGEVYSWNYPRLPTGASLHIASALSDWLTERKTTAQMYDAITKAIRSAASRAEELQGQLSGGGG